MHCVAFFFEDVDSIEKAHMKLSKEEFRKVVKKLWERRQVELTNAMAQVSRSSRKCMIWSTKA